MLWLNVDSPSGFGGPSFVAARNFCFVISKSADFSANDGSGNAHPDGDALGSMLAMADENTRWPKVKKAAL